MSVVNTTLIQAIKHAHEINPYQLKGTVEIYGCSFHVELIRVEDGPGGMRCPPRDAESTTLEKFTDMQNYYDGVYETMTLPGREGKWVMFVIPFCE